MDDSLEDLARRWRASGSLPDEIALVAARSRAGLIEERNLQTAAGLGYPCARALLGGAAPPSWDAERWERPPLGRLELKRAALAAARALLALAAWPSLEPRLDAAEVAVVCPCQAHGWAVIHAGPALPEILPSDWGRSLLSSGEPDPAFLRRYAAARAVELACSAAAAITQASRSAEDALASAREVLSPDALNALVAPALGPWLLGHADPLRERVEREQPAALAAGSAAAEAAAAATDEALARAAREGVEIYQWSDAGSGTWEPTTVTYYRHPSGRVVEVLERTHLDHGDSVRRRWLEPDAAESEIERWRQREP